MFWKDETDVLEVTSKKACLTGEGSGFAGVGVNSDHSKKGNNS